MCQGHESGMWKQNEASSTSKIIVQSGHIIAKADSEAINFKKDRRFGFFVFPQVAQVWVFLIAKKSLKIT